MPTPKRLLTLLDTRDGHTCSVDGCERTRYCKGYCTMHYQRWRTHGDPAIGRKGPSMDVCTVDGCDEVAKTRSRTLCLAHYVRWKNGRDLTAPKRATRKRRGTCVVTGCDHLDRGPHGYCSKHWVRVQHNGSPDIVVHQRDRDNKWAKHPRWTGEEATYTAMHQRVRKLRGRASGHACVDCGRAARHWSYTHTDPAERRSEQGPYSVDVAYYDPRCVKCHKRFDLDRK